MAGSCIELFLIKIFQYVSWQQLRSWVTRGYASILRGHAIQHGARQKGKSPESSSNVCSVDQIINSIMVHANAALGNFDDAIVAGHTY